jgi:hypothetical protein
MATHRLLPPANGPKLNQPTISNGRSYVAAPGTAVDVQDFDAEGLVAAGWTFVALSGPTSQRPTSALGLNNLAQGARFFDTSLNVEIIWDGVTWRDVAARRGEIGFGRVHETTRLNRSPERQALSMEV